MKRYIVLVVMTAVVAFTLYGQVEVPTHAQHEQVAQAAASSQQQINELKTRVTNLETQIGALSKSDAEQNTKIAALEKSDAEQNTKIADHESRIAKIEAGGPVEPPGTPPVAEDQVVSLDQDTSFSGQVTAKDAESDQLVYSVVQTSIHGNTVLNSDGTFTYTPEPNYYGVDSFTFKANDGKLDSAAAAVSITVVQVVVDPPAGEPTRLLFKDDFEYVGSFRVPASTDWRDIHQNYSYGLTGMSYNAENDSLFVVGHDHHQMISEIKIPELRNVHDVTFAGLARSTVMQRLESVTSRVPNYTLEGNVKVGGTMLADDKKLVVSLYEYYDADADAVNSHYLVDPANVATGTVTGLFRVGTEAGGKAGGYMARVPDVWREKMGMPYVCGLNGVPITSRTSQGPVLIGFDTADWSKSTRYLAYPYASGQPYSLETLLGYGAWNQTAFAHGIAFVEDTACVLFFGRIGEGELIYGGGTSDPALHNTVTPEGMRLAYDPCGSSKGYHAYPYVTRVWAYKVADLLEAKAGTIKPHEIKPYAMFNLTGVLPNAENGCWPINSVAYDAKNGRVIVAQSYNGEFGEPGVHVLKIKAPAANAKSKKKIKP